MVGDIIIYYELECIITLPAHIIGGILKVENKVEQLPFDLEDDIGEIRYAEKICPGVYYVSARDFETYLPQEYYVVYTSEALISDQVRSYGKQTKNDPLVLLYHIGGEGDFDSVIKYEIKRCLAKNNLPPLDDEDVHTTAYYGMEKNPEYFGDYPAPMQTPRGITTRYKRLGPGVFALETDRFERMVAVCYPVWKVDLRAETQKAGEQTEYDQKKGIDNTLGFLFFPEEVGCVVLFELWRWYRLVFPDTIDHAALMKAIWTYQPDYAAQFNLLEQVGVNDVGARFLQQLGADVEPEGRAENLIRLNPDAGTDYLRF